MTIVLFNRNYFWDNLLPKQKAVIVTSLYPSSTTLQLNALASQHFEQNVSLVNKGRENARCQGQAEEK